MHYHMQCSYQLTHTVSRLVGWVQKNSSLSVPYTCIAMTQYLGTIFPSRYGSEGEKASKKKEMAEEKGKKKTAGKYKQEKRQFGHGANDWNY